MIPYVRAKKVSSEPALIGFFAAFFTLGAGDWNDNFTITCGKCNWKFEKRMHSHSKIAKCTCCGVQNRWD